MRRPSAPPKLSRPHKRLVVRAKIKPRRLRVRASWPVPLLPKSNSSEIQDRSLHAANDFHVPAFAHEDRLVHRVCGKGFQIGRVAWLPELVGRAIARRKDERLALH